MHSLPRLRRHRPRNRNLLLRILHLEPEPPNHASKRTPQFRPRKVLANARPLTMQEGNLGEIRRRAAVVVGRPSARLWIRVDPAFGQEIVARRPPEFGTPVDGVRDDDDARALGDERAGDAGVADGFADRGGDRGEEAEDLLAHAVEQGEGFEVGPRDRAVGRGYVFADLCAEALLDFGM